MTRFPLLLLLASILSTLLGISLNALPQGIPPKAWAQVQSGCGLAAPAFCDTFTEGPSPVINRAGQLSTAWGVSRVGSGQTSSTFLDAWLPATAQYCNTASVLPPGDIQVCNGSLVDTVSDGEQSTSLAMYVKQPLGVAGRTGRAVFDVGNDSEGGHAAWPDFVYTSLPSPAPTKNIPGAWAPPQQSFGFELDELCGGGQGSCQNVPTLAAGQSCISVGYGFSTNNYAYSDTSTGAPQVQDVSCNIEPTATQILSGQLNHYEVDFLPSGSEVDVYGSDPGQGVAGQRLIAKITGFTMPLSQGVIWIEDEHYNGNKFNNQGDHSFVWRNVGFDGPVLPRDLDVEVPDALTPCNQGLAGCYSNLGYLFNTATTSAPLTLTFAQQVTSQMLAGSGGLVSFNEANYSSTLNNIEFQLNNGPEHVFNWPNSTPSWLSVGVPVSLSEVHTGTNTLTFQSLLGDHVTVANVDLKFIGAGGTVPCNCPGTGPTQTPTQTPSATTTNSPTPTATPTMTPSFTSSAAEGPDPVTEGGTATLTASVTNTSNQPINALVDLEIYDLSGNKASQQYWDDQGFALGQMLSFHASWQVPVGAQLGGYTAELGVFTPGWGTLYNWNDKAAEFTVTSASVASPTPGPTPSSTPSPIPTSTASSTTFIVGASVSPDSVKQGGSLNFTASAQNTSGQDAAALIDLEVYDPSGNKAFQQFWDNQSFGAGQTQNFSTSWTVPANGTIGAYRVTTGVFGPGWSHNYDWNNAAASFSVVGNSASSSPMTFTAIVLDPTSSGITGVVGGTQCAGAQTLPPLTWSNISVNCGTPGQLVGFDVDGVPASLLTAGGSCPIYTPGQAFSAPVYIYPSVVDGACGASLQAP